MLIVNLLFLKQGKQCLTALFIFLFQLVYSQKQFIVKDSITKEKLEFVKIQIDENVYYTDSLGEFTVNHNVENQYLTLHRFGYESNKVMYDKIKNEILLKPKVTELQEVVINRNKKFILGDRLHKKSTTHLSDIVELGILIENNKNSIGILKSIEFFIKNKNITEDSYLEISFIEVGKDKKISENSIKTIVKPINQILKNKNKIDLDSYDIPISEYGILIGLKVIGKIGNDKKNTLKSVLQFYNSKSKDNIYMKNYKSWIKYPTKVDVINVILNIN